MSQNLFSYPQVDHQSYISAFPFPHAVIRGGWDEDKLCLCKEELTGFDDWDGQKDFYGAQLKQYCSNMEKLPESVKCIIYEASSPRFLRWLEDLTGEVGLIPDPYLEGGGVHRIKPGGFLKVHADFNWNGRLKLYRRLNVLIYINPGWKEEWGGCSDCGVRICSQNASLCCHH